MEEIKLNPNQKINPDEMIIIEGGNIYEFVKKLQEENKELKESIKKYLKLYSNYYKALEEIREVLCEGRTFYDGYFDNENLSRTDKAIKVINEVLQTEESEK